MNRAAAACGFAGRCSIHPERGAGISDQGQSSRQGDPMEYLYAGHPERVLAIIGAQDPYTPPDQVTELFESGVTVCEYPHANHGFAHDATRPAHRAEDAADAFARTHEWLLAE